MNKSRINAVTSVVVVMTALCRSTVYRVVLKADQRSHDEKCVTTRMKQQSGSSSLSAAEAEIILQFSEMVERALYTSHERSRVFTGSYGLCVNARTYSRKSLAV